MAQRGFSVRLYFPDGDPQGVRMVERSNWTGQGLAFPRLQLPKARERPELKRTGVYVLTTHEEHSGKPSIYIGQSDNVLSRLLDHNANKEFWDEAVAFTSKDDSFNGSHARFLEAHLIQLALERDRATVLNANVPTPPPISEADQADALRFLDDMLTCIQVLGVSAFRGSRQQPTNHDTGELMFYLKIGEADAQAKIDDGEFVVLAGSTARKTATQSFLTRPEFKTEVTRRQEFIDNGTFADEGEHYRVTRDFRYGTPSSPTCALTGSAPDPYQQWKTKDGRTLNEVLRGGDDE